MSVNAAAGGPDAIEPLESCRDLIPLLAQWYHSEWVDIEGLSLPTLEAELVAHLPGDARTGSTWVAFEAGRPVGTVSLDDADLPGYAHLTPWLASLYVVADRRGSGLGRRLVEHAIRQARLARVARLHLWTAGTGRLYAALGFTAIAQASYGCTPITVMRLPLAVEPVART